MGIKRGNIVITGSKLRDRNYGVEIRELNYKNVYATARLSQELLNNTIPSDPTESNEASHVIRHMIEIPRCPMERMKMFILIDGARWDSVGKIRRSPMESHGLHGAKSQKVPPTRSHAMLSLWRSQLGVYQCKRGQGEATFRENMQTIHQKMKWKLSATTGGSGDFMSPGFNAFGGVWHLTCSKTHGALVKVGLVLTRTTLELDVQFEISTRTSSGGEDDFLFRDQKVFAENNHRSKNIFSAEYDEIDVFLHLINYKK
ncbi:unnamed protein product [Owenia fusiformis]|uniref:Uncharacterized protein n=1 Tax=Owenia fusiformis TaxID=6347 RepID=A0A8S4Q686_OWEFU|nr:unnamed protein product [Owenia fusiformis]